MAESTFTKVSTSIPKETEEQVVRVIGIVNENIDRAGGMDAPKGTHGRLDFPLLIQVLLEDVAYIRTRPGSWEGCRMADLLEHHGYDVTERF